MAALHLPIVSTTELRTFRRCAREHHYSYRLKYKPIHVDAALRFGTLWHLGQEVWWSTAGDLDLALAAFNTPSDSGVLPDPYEVAMAQALMLGYHAAYYDEPLTVLAVEREFLVPILNPETGAASRTFQLGGKIDAIAQHDVTGRVFIVEHKTSSEDIGLESNYWRRLRLDSQISNYYYGARAEGFAIEGCLYDVVKKPMQRPSMATPIEKRKYTERKSKGCPSCKKKGSAPAPHTYYEDAEARSITCEGGRLVTDPGGKLYANMREHDETPDEYRARLLEEIGADPQKYFMRGELTRRDTDVREADQDRWDQARLVREADLADRHPRNVDACIRYGRECEFFNVCTGQASIDDPTLFRRNLNKHDELTAPAAAE